MKGLFSVVIPSFNRPNCVSRAIDSAIRCGEDIEIILVNDGSTMSYNDVIDKYGGRVRYFENKENCGVSHSRNVGILSSCSDWITFLDDDDELHQDYFFRLRESMLRNEKARVFWSGSRIMRTISERAVFFDRTFPIQYEQQKYLIKEFLSVGMGFGVTIKRSVLNEIGLFDTSFHVGEDTELFFRILDRGYIPAPIAGIGVTKNECHTCRLSSDLEVYSKTLVYERIFDLYRDTFCKERIFNYLHLLMWSYRLHRKFGNKPYEREAWNALVNMNVCPNQIELCYDTGRDIEFG